ncbi:MAG TPA: N-acetylmuramoyl-L-alanine amidase [bacterium]|nr:N-acetylmuramoyl-L-alanine amidase [bacterium]
MRRFALALLLFVISASPAAEVLSLNAAPAGTGAWVSLGLDGPLPDGGPAAVPVFTDGAWRWEIPGLTLERTLSVGRRWPLLGVALEPGPDGATLTAELDGEGWGVCVLVTDDPPALGLRFDSPHSVPAAPSIEDARVRLIVLDPGHGGPRWTGAGGPRTGVFEKDLVLDIAGRVRAMLEEELDVEIVLTRTGDYPVGLRERVRTANEMGADLFLSLHLNGGPSERRGPEMYYADHHRPDTPWSPEGGARFALPLTGELPFPARLEAARLLARLTFEELTAPSAGVARSLLEAHVGLLGLPDRGAWPASFFVLVEARMPAVLVESCYLSNAEQEALLSDPAYRQRVARAIADGTAAWVRENDLVPESRHSLAQGD